MSAPAAPFVDQILRQQMISRPADKLTPSIRRETAGLFYRANLRYTTREIQAAHQFLVASDFSKKSLVSMGVSTDRIHMCRYGAASETPNGTIVPGEDVLRVFFVGTFSARKGADLFLNVAARLSRDEFSFNVIGSVPAESAELADQSKQMLGLNFFGHIPHEEVQRELLRADVLLFPSLADGFGLSVMEAMAAGTAIICSSNAGVSDLIDDGKNGFVISPNDHARVCELLMQLREDGSLLHSLKANARLTAHARSWHDYYGDVEQALTRVLGRDNT